jgi:hypothetical protein
MILSFGSADRNVFSADFRMIGKAMGWHAMASFGPHKPQTVGFIPKIFKKTPLLHKKRHY